MEAGCYFLPLLFYSHLGMQRVILAVSNDITTDQRLHKVCTSLHKRGFSPLLVGRNRPTSIPLSDRSYQTQRLPMWFDSGKFFYLELNIRLFFFLLFRKVDIITANDLDTLLPCFLVARLKGVKLVYDSHEYFTEVPELAHRAFERKLWTRLEEFIFPRLSQVSTVAASIADIYSHKYNVPVKVVRNLPNKSVDHSPSPKMVREKVILYQGAINMGRGIELMMETMPLLPEYVFWIIGDGPLFAELSARARTRPNIQFLGRVPFEKLSAYTEKAIIGLSLEEDLGLNYRFALPNKIFDYLQAQVPIICSDLPEMKQVVNAYGLGRVLTERNPSALAQLIKEMVSDEDLMRDFQKNCAKASRVLNWESEEEVLLSLYR